MRHFTWASLLIIGVFTAVASGQTGAINGSVLDPKDKGVDNALVTANFAPVSGPADPKTRNLRATTDKSGNFSFTKVPIGVYRVCVQASDPGLLDPCRWSLPVLVKLAPNQNVAGLRIVLEQGARLQVRVNDAGQLLAKNEGKIKGAQLSLGIWTGNNLFRALPVTGRDNAGRDYAIYVPQDRSVRLSRLQQVFSTG